MRKKKLLTILLCIAVIFGYAACGSDNADDGNSGADSQVASDDSSQESEATEDGGSSDGSSASSSSSSSQNENREYGDLMKALKKTDLYAGELTTGFVGDTMSNEFFDWTVNSVKTMKKLEGKSAGSGKKFIVANITVTNTTDYDYSIMNADFIGYMEASEDGHLDTEWSFYDGMYPDEATLKSGKSRTGDLVFIVDEDVDEIVIDYIEFAGDGSMGNTNWVDVFL